MHIDDVVAVLKYEDLRNVILVGHSYGGMVITGAADTAPSRVGHLVYLDAATPTDGQSLADVSPDLMEMARSMGKVVDGVGHRPELHGGGRSVLRRDGPGGARVDAGTADPAAVEDLRAEPPPD